MTAQQRQQDERQRPEQPYLEVVTSTVLYVREYAWLYKAGPSWEEGSLVQALTARTHAGCRTASAEAACGPPPVEGTGLACPTAHAASVAHCKHKAHAQWLILVSGAHCAYIVTGGKGNV